MLAWEKNATSKNVISVVSRIVVVVVVVVVVIVIVVVVVALRQIFCQEFTKRI